MGETESRPAPLRTPFTGIKAREPRLPDFHTHYARQTSGLKELQASVIVKKTAMWYNKTKSAAKGHDVQNVTCLTFLFPTRREDYQWQATYRKQ